MGMMTRRREQQRKDDELRLQIAKMGIVSGAIKTAAEYNAVLETGKIPEQRQTGEETVGYNISQPGTPSFRKEYMKRDERFGQDYPYIETRMADPVASPIRNSVFEDVTMSPSPKSGFLFNDETNQWERPPDEQRRSAPPRGSSAESPRSKDARAIRLNALKELKLGPLNEATRQLAYEASVYIGADPSPFAKKVEERAEPETPSLIQEGKAMARKGVKKAGEMGDALANYFKKKEGGSNGSGGAGAGATGSETATRRQDPKTKKWWRYTKAGGWVQE